MTREQWENDLLLEAQALQVLSPLFETFIIVLEEEIQERGEHVDPLLLIGLRSILQTTNAVYQKGVTVTLNDGSKIKIPSILQELEDVMDEIQVLQAGLKTKEGIPDEDTPKDDSG